MTQTPAEKLKALRAALKAEKLNGFIIPRQDEFQGEYVAPYAERLRWLTGFAGSWGTGIVLDKKAAIFVDGRYTVQVREQTDGKLFEPKHLVDESPTGWVTSQLEKGDKLGFDPMLLTVSEARRYQKAAEAAGAKLVPVKKNLIDMIWKDQPARSTKPLFVQPDKFAGKSAAQKLKELAAQLKKAGTDAAFLAEPSSVAWLLNLRGSDVAYTPVVLAYAILHANAKAELFIEPNRIPDEVKKALQGVATVYDPKYLKDRLKKFTKKTVILDEGSAPDAVRAILETAKSKIVYGTDPCTMPKAQKNEVERQGARDAQRRDGAALSNFLHFMAVEGPKGQLTERSAAERLQQFRQATNMLEDLSFPSISAAGGHAAIPHYFVTDASSAPIKNNEIFLMDSGGQYRDGTTDVTRTMIVGTPTAEMKDRFTRVLKGMIGISVARFPEGTTGAHLDALARNALWQAGLDFDHGTGHGVGSFLSVHEGPARISKASHIPLKPGMILSNEPGYYKPGQFGIRIENLLIVTEPAEIEGGERKMMGFETLTWAPIDRHLIDVTLLTPDELKWLNAYHARVEKELAPMVQSDSLEWLKNACAPL